MSFVKNNWKTDDVYTAEAVNALEDAVVELEGAPEGAVRLTGTLDDGGNVIIDVSEADFAKYTADKTPLMLEVVTEEKSDSTYTAVLYSSEYFVDTSKDEYRICFIGSDGDSVFVVDAAPDEGDVVGDWETHPVLPYVDESYVNKHLRINEYGEVEWADPDGPFYVHGTLGTESDGVTPITIQEARADVDAAVEAGREVVLLVDTTEVENEGQENESTVTTTWYAPLVTKQVTEGETGISLGFAVSLPGVLSMVARFTAGATTGSGIITVAGA